MRDLCPALQNKTYFNYGGQGPLPSPSLEAITASWKHIQDLGPFTADVWPYIATEVNSTRRLLAQCCGVPPHRLALTENVTSGCVLPLWGLPFAEGDRLLIGDCEHPGVVSACVELARRRNLAIDVLPVKHLRGDQAHCDAAVIETIEETLSPRTRLVVLSHLLWNTGQVMPIAAVAHQLKQHPHHPFLLVDAAQSFGQILVDKAAAAADIYAFTGHKWACGPEGLGGVALSERVVSEAAPTVIGWRSLRDESKADLNGSDLFHHDSRRFEVATSCVPLMAGLRSSLQLLEQEGSPQERWDRIRKLSSKLWQALHGLERVTPLLDVAPASGLVSFQINGDFPPAEHVKQLGAKGLWIRDLADPSCLRACTHISTTADDIDALMAAISTL
ncbi:aminotransferase class V-fold PLP-dependent enzyme [Synechococcus sp. KORDI-52]|uniref:aminotransferase class V-fold PLP-dependent enzyme n=1 Tax=Synechococcus sp. KORDI-52 TaxID=585425 RepID=UPI000571465E|nr:aminotransferase class V-fold PLP-dependent enzyme [Synechococcus sp. KORDI-52]